ncbi:hypothetical protein EON63_00525 [archaeon]|nr:MAG: hypothetical protein EON63_00525 [archaeon]
MPHLYLYSWCIYTRLESEKAKVAFEMEHEVEMLLAKRLKGIITDLRRAWEIEVSSYTLLTYPYPYPYSYL